LKEEHITLYKNKVEVFIPVSRKDDFINTGYSEKKPKKVKTKT